MDNTMGHYDFTTEKKKKPNLEKDALINGTYSTGAMEFSAEESP